MSPRLDAIGLVVSNMGDAMNFYRKLGLEFVTGDKNQDHTEARGPGGLRIMFDTEESVKSFSDWQKPVGSHRVALVFLCDNAQEVDRIFGELSAGGGKPHLPPFDAPWGQRYATVLDKDGNGIDLFAPLTTSETSG